MLNLWGECDLVSDWPIITPGIYIYIYNDNISSIWLNTDQIKKVFKGKIVATKEIREFYDIHIYQLQN